VPQGEDRRSSFLERHWPLAVSVLALAVLCLVYLASYTTAPRSAGRGLLLAVLPAVVASLAIAACLYVLLNRDFRAMRSVDLNTDLPQLLQREINSMNIQLQALLERMAVLRKRSSLPPLDAFLDEAKVISIAAVSGLGLVNHYRGLLEEQLKEGKRIRVLLLDIDQRDAFSVWDRFSNPPMNSPEDDIRSGTRQFLGLADLADFPGRCEVRVLDTLFPYSLIMSEQTHGGTIQVELHAYRRAPEHRPNLLISSDTEPHWFLFFSQQFNEAWEHAKSARK
jgi:hypothetical protein